MNKIRVLSVVLCVCIMVVFGMSLVNAEEPKTMTNAQLSDILIRILEVGTPEGSENLTENELFKAQAKLLADMGITVFIKANPNDLVTRGMLCGILDKALQQVPEDMGVGMVPTRGSVSSLFNDSLFGYSGEKSVNEMSGSINNLSCSIGSENDVLEFAKVLEALNVPALSNAVAEAYSAPGQDTRGTRGVQQAGIGNLVPAQNPIPEDLKDLSTTFASQN